MSISDSSGRQRSRPDSLGRLVSARDDLPDGRADTVHWQAIGFDPGAGGSSSPPAPPPRPDFGPDPGVVDPTIPPTQPPATGERPCTQWVIWEAWFTQRDERVCPECGPLHGQRFRQGEGPWPPLHTSCRCFRQEVDRECVSRRAGGAGAGENY
jgi:hypothetical protein